MKQNDIFNRLNKKADIPVSLFPASSMHRTSMRIGRLTPMYSVNMFQGNKIELSASQLTRFSTLDHPVMNNYEINLGFFFVPWTAHDEMGTSAWFRKNQLYNSTSTTAQGRTETYYKYKLNANEFFDPAFDNALRHHPIKVKLKNLGNIKLVGSLYDHLGYFIGSGVDVSNYDKFYTHAYNASNGATGGTQNTISGMVGGTPLGFKVSSSAWVADKLCVCSTTSTASTLTNTDRCILPIDLFCIMNYWYSTVNTDFDTMTFTAFQTYYNTYVSNLVTQSYFQKLIGATQTALGVGGSSTAPVGEWSDYYGNLKPAQVLDAYNEYLNSIALYAKEGDFSLNCLDWLNYMRIYADWFLNDHFTRRDDFLDMIGCAYYGACACISSNTAWTVPSCFSVGSSSASMANSGNGKTYSNPELRFFADYIRKGECLPVLWELSRYTAQRCEIDMTGIAGLTDTASSLSPGDTSVGTTIREHFFNRAVQKFKDLVSRVGYDFRNNTREIYGSGVSDSTLNRSQLVAIKRFAVNVGDVQQTSESSSKGTLGDFGGFAYSKNGTDKVSWKAEQNGTFMVMAWIRPRNVAYATGVDREKMKDDYLDYLIPQFGGVGYQDVYANEVYATASNSPTASLGHEEIYSEYMSVPNHVTGNMRTYNKAWHSDRFFNSNPLVAKEKSPKFLYITEDDDIDRIFSNSIDDPVLCTCYFDGNITRQLPSRIRTDF